jgi:effector-binding domain-containing protein
MGDLKFFHDRWSPWTEKDPNMKVTYEGTPGQIGHFYSWSGNKDVREGSMRIAAINGDTISEDLSFSTHADRKDATVNLIAKDNGGSTSAKWQMIMNVGFLHRAPMLFINMDKMMGPDFEKGMANLKTVLESSSDESAATSAANYEVKELEWPETNFIGSKKETVEFQNVPAYLGKHLPAIFEELEKNKIQPEAAPSGIYWSYDEANGKTDMAAAIKVPVGSKVKGFETYKFPASKVLHVAYYGNYDKTMPAHEAIGKFMKEKGYTQTAAIEEYVTDPMVEKDTAKWLSNIYYIIKK